MSDAVEGTLAPAPRTRRIWGSAIGTAGVFAILGGAAWAWGQVSGGGAQPHDVLSDDTVLYVRIDGDPSAKQKLEILRLIRKVPSLADELEIDDEQQDLRRLLLEEALEDCDLDYDTDVAPWIGDRFGIGATDVGFEGGHMVVQVTDERAARSTLEILAACEVEDDEPGGGFAFLDGYAILSDDQEAADAAVAHAKDNPLADRSDFREDMDALGDQGVASFWIDLAAAREDEGFREGFLADTEPFEQEAQDLLDSLQSAAAALRAAGGGAELVATLRADAITGSETTTRLATLPTDTGLAINIGAGTIDALRPLLVDGFMTGFTDGVPPDEVDDMLAFIQEEYGISTASSRTATPRGWAPTASPRWSRHAARAT